jgi:hypothetical protein
MTAADSPSAIAVFRIIGKLTIAEIKCVIKTVKYIVRTVPCPAKPINGLPKHQETIFKAGAGMRGTISQAEHALRGETMTRRATSVETAFADFLFFCYSWRYESNPTSN